VCFSAEADFVSGAVIGAIGIATLTKVDRPRELPLAVLPLAFALHQIAEGFVWRDLDSGAARSSGVAVYLYLAFAWVVLPILAPLAVMILEPPGWRRRAIGVFVVLGSMAGAYLAAAIVSDDVSAHAVEHTVQYGGAGQFATAATALYILATCGAPLLSGFRAIVWFGLANLVAVAAFATIQAEGFTSLWCTWAAVVSVLIYLQFVFWRRGDDSIDREIDAALTTA
jgi:Family of unknown function (DUF6629)